MSAAARTVLARSIDCLEILDKRPRPMCRDCADEDGVCPNGGLDCDMRKLIADARAAITPPVAAGSVDTVSFRDLLRNVQSWIEGGVIADQEFALLVAHINTWGAQQREAGRQEGYADGRGMANEIAAAIDKAAQVRAEKAEAELAQVNEWRNAALQENMRVSDIWMDRVTRSETRVKDLEVESAHKQSIIDRLMLEHCPDEMTAEQTAEWAKHHVRAPAGIVGSGPNAKEGDRPCWTPDCGTF